MPTSTTQSALVLMAAAVGSSRATNVVFTATRRETNTHDFAEVFTFNTETKNYSQVNGTGNKPPGTADFTSGGCLCGSKYYAIFTDMSSASWGITSTDISTGQMDVSETPVLYHGVWCHPTEDKLIAVGSEPGSKSAVFTARLFDPAAPMSDTVIATLDFNGKLWSGQDTLFSYNAKINQLWAAFPTDSELDKTGKIVVVDFSAANPNVTTVYDMPLGGWPFLVVAGSQGRGGVHKKSRLPGDVEDLEWVEISLPTGSSKAGIKNTGVDVFTTLGMPQGAVGVCADGTILSFDRVKIGTLYAVNGDTGATLWTADVSSIGSDKFYFGAIGC